MSLPISEAHYFNRDSEKSFHFFVGTLGGSLKKIAKKMIPRVETKRNV